MAGPLRPVLALGVLVIALAAIVAVELGDDDLTGDATSTSTTATTGGTTTTTTSSSTTSSTTATAPSSTTTTSARSTLSQPVVEARPGGGSGEVQLSWQAVAGATGYRVGRADGGGSFVQVLDIDVRTGTASAAPEVVNAFSPNHSYVPAGGRLATPDPSTTFTVIDLSGPGERCFRVAAYDGDGEGPPSQLACGTPP